MQSESGAEREASGVFWWWRAPNDSLRTGERSELEAGLRGGVLTPRSFVWRSDWRGWLQAAEVAQLQDAILPDLRMPVAAPKLSEPASVPPPLPPLFEFLCEAQQPANTDSEPSPEITRTEIDIQPSFLDWREEELTVPGAVIDDEVVTSLYIEPFVEPPAESPIAKPLHERALAAIRAHLPALQLDWQSRVLRATVFVGCAIALVTLAAINAVALNRALLGHPPSLVVTVAGPSQTRVADAAVFVDGEFQCVQAPCRIALEPGIHLVSVAAPGFAPPAAKAVQIERDLPLHFDLIQTSEQVAAFGADSQDR